MGVVQGISALSRIIGAVIAAPIALFRCWDLARRFDDVPLLFDGARVTSTSVTSPLGSPCQRPYAPSWAAAQPATGQSAADLQSAEALDVRRLLDAIPGMMFVMTADGLPEYMNQPLIRALGTRCKEIPNAGWKAFVHPDDVGALAEAWSTSVRSGARLNAEFRSAQDHGGWRWVHCSIEPCRGPRGQIERWYGSVVDVDDRRRAEETTRRTKYALRQIIETIPALVWRATPAGEVDYANPRLVAYTGGTLETLRSVGWTGLIHSDDREQSMKDLKRSFDTGESYAANFRMQDTQGVYRWFEVRAEPLLNAEGAIDHWYGILVDIDDRRQLQAELLQTQQRLAKASHIAIVGELAASIAHEINQPLSALAANADACERWLTGDAPNIERACRSLRSIQRDIAGTSSIVRRMRALYKQTPPIKVPLNINEVIIEVHDLLLEECASRSALLNLELATPMPSTLADGIQIQQVLINLIHNGLDAMSDPAPPRILLIRSREEGPHIVVEVLDGGSGFQHAERLFEAFFTTKADGMGMGLAICRSIIDAHGGRIWAEPRAPRGSIFSFSIPLLT